MSGLRKGWLGVNNWAENGLSNETNLQGSKDKNYCGVQLVSTIPKSGRPTTLTRDPFHELLNQRAQPRNFLCVHISQFFCILYCHSGNRPIVFSIFFTTTRSFQFSIASQQGICAHTGVSPSQYLPQNGVQLLGAQLVGGFAAHLRSGSNAFNIVHITRHIRATASRKVEPLGAGYVR